MVSGYERGRWERETKQIACGRCCWSLVTGNLRFYGSYRPSIRIVHHRMSSRRDRWHTHTHKERTLFTNPKISSKAAVVWHRRGVCVYGSIGGGAKNNNTKISITAHNNNDNHSKLSGIRNLLKDRCVRLLLPGSLPSLDSVTNHQFRLPLGGPIWTGGNIH